MGKRTISPLLDTSRQPLNASKESMRRMALFILNAVVHMKSASAVPPEISSRLNSARAFVGEDRQAHGVQTRQRRSKNMATIEGRKSLAQSRPRRQIP